MSLGDSIHDAYSSVATSRRSGRSVHRVGWQTEFVIPLRLPQAAFGSRHATFQRPHNDSLLPRNGLRRGVVPRGYVSALGLAVRPWCAPRRKRPSLLTSGCGGIVYVLDSLFVFRGEVAHWSSRLLIGTRSRPSDPGTGLRAFVFEAVDVAIVG